MQVIEQPHKARILPAVPQNDTNYRHCDISERIPDMLRIAYLLRQINHW